MKLYVNPASPNCRRALLVAKSLDLPVEIVNVDMRAGAHREPWFLAINPNHKVPALEDGALKLWESNAIAQYLAAKAGRTDLWPTDPAAQAEVSKWQFWTHTHWNHAANPVIFERVLKAMFGMGPPDEAVVAAKLAETRTELQVLDRHLAGRQWLAADHVTIADLSLGASLMYAAKADLPFAEFPNAQAWLERVRALPAWKATDV